MVTHFHFSKYSAYTLLCQLSDYKKNNNIVTISKTLIQTNTKYRAHNIIIIIYNHCLLYIWLLKISNLTSILYIAYKNHTINIQWTYVHIHTQSTCIQIIYTHTHTYISTWSAFEFSKRGRKRERESDHSEVRSIYCFTIVIITGNHLL
jgi:hypothetical protein